MHKFDEDKLQYNKLSWWEKYKWSIMGILSGIIISFYIGILKNSGENEVKIIEGEVVSTIIIPQPEFSPELLREYLESINIKHPDIAYAQAVLETGQFSSRIFKENHNLFGMKAAKNRPFTHLGENRGHALYKDWKMSVIDYALYSASYLRDLRTKDQYYQYLGNHYAEDPNYVSKVKKIVKKLNYK